MSCIEDYTGLDGVELILAVEDAFQIHIADEEAGNVSTVGDLHNLVVGKLQGQDSKRCLTSAAFYEPGVESLIRLGSTDARSGLRRRLRSYYRGTADVRSGDAFKLQ
jgi:hypothetical protein